MLRKSCYNCNGVGHKLLIKRYLEGERIFPSDYHMKKYDEVYCGNYEPCIICGGYGTLIYDLCDECTSRKLNTKHHHHMWCANGKVYTRRT